MFTFQIAKQSAVEVMEICRCILQVQSWILDVCHMAKNKTDNLLVRTDATRQRSFLSVKIQLGPGKYCNIFLIIFIEF